MKKLLMLGAMVVTAAAFSSTETAQAGVSYNGYVGGRYLHGNGAVQYVPRSNSYGHSAPRNYGSHSYSRSNYGHGRSYGYSGGHGYSNRYGGHGYANFGIQTRGFSFGYHR